ncbi:MAG: hypothetical protein FRX49_09644 [Trebouxia sp. A1-2]|nr:MAG: hypothetical protein FRX49_09644 [Trebouxia sp. A1-2]
MDTSNKIRVVEQDTLRLKRTDSGGVREPSDPKHYPTLGGIEGAVAPATTPRTLSTLGSFKDILLSRPDIPKLQIGTEGLSGASSSSSPTEAAARLDNQEDGFAPPSPKKIVTQAAQRRRTADEQAREDRFHQDLAHPNTFAALEDGSVCHVGEESSEELSQGPLAEADNREEPGQDSVAGSQNRSRWGLAWSKTLGVVAVVKEHPVTTSLVVTAITVGFMLSTRRKKFPFVPT